MRKGVDFIGNTVVFACHDGQGNYLLAKRSKNCRDEHGTWDCGGGSIELGDGVIDTLKKEIFEEYGTEILDYEFLGYHDAHREHNGERTHWIALDFKVLLDRDTVRNNEPHKHEEIGWFKLGQFPQPYHSQFPYFLEKYKNQL